MDPWTAIGIALIGAIAGVAGAIGGTLIAASATRQAAEMARDEARLARFADRIRELGGIVLDSAYRFTEAVSDDEPELPYLPRAVLAETCRRRALADRVIEQVKLPEHPSWRRTRGPRGFEARLSL